LLGVSPPTAVSHAGCIDYGDYMHLAGRVDNLRHARSITAFGNCVYVASGQSGLQTIDVTIPEQPLLVNIATIHDVDSVSFADLLIVDRYIYIVDEINGLVIFDITAPMKPKYVTRIPTAGIATFLAVSEDAAYVYERSSGNIFNILVLDTSIPDSPSTLCRFGIPGDVRDCSVSGGTMFYLTSTAVLQAIDVTNPNSPQLADQMQLTGIGYDLVATGTTVYAYTTNIFPDHHLAIVDATDPFALRSVAIDDFIGNFMTISENTLFVGGAEDNSNFRAYDLSTPDNPDLLASLMISGSTIDVDISGGRAYSLNTGSDSTFTLNTVNIMNLDTPDALSLADLTDFIWDIAFNDQFGFAAIGDHGVEVIDFHDPGAPRSISRVDTGSSRAIAISGHYAYVADYYDGIRILDISDPYQPVYVSSIGTPDFTSDIEIAGDYAYVAANHGGVLVVDIHDAGNPRIVHTVDTSETSHGGARGLAIAGQFVYVAAYGSQLQVIDISAPLQARVVGSVEYGTSVYPDKVALFGHYALVSTMIRGLRIVDVSKPSNPVVVGGINSQDAAGIAVDDKYAYYADSRLGMMVLDMSNPEHPAVVNNVKFGTSCSGIVASDETIYVINWKQFAIYPGHCITETPDELDVIDVHHDFIVGLPIAIHPNPFNASTTIGFDCRTPSNVNVSVYDLHGRRVFVIADKHFDSGHHDLQWHGTNQEGRSLASGTYMIRVSTLNQSVTQRSILIK